MPHRHAIFACPPRDDPLTALAARWLGRHAWSGEATTQPSVAGIGEATAFPRRYGFHATIVAPFRPAPGVAARDVDARLDAFCATEAPIPLPLRVERLGAFLALVPAGPSAALDAMEARAVRHFHALRAEPGAEEIARRRPERLTARQREHLARWHYPYVLDEFRYHMTLTGPVPDGEAPGLREAIERHFPADILAAHALDGLARYDEPAPDSPFLVAHRAPFAATRDGAADAPQATAQPDGPS